MSEKTFSCRPVSPLASFEIAGKFADKLEARRESTLFLPERGRLIGLLAEAIAVGEIQMTGYNLRHSPGLTSVSASLTSDFLKVSDKSLQPRNTSIRIDSSLVECSDVVTTPDAFQHSVTH